MVVCSAVPNLRYAKITRGLEAVVAILTLTKMGDATNDLTLKKERRK